MMRGLRMLDQSGLPYQVSSVLTTYNCDPRTLTDLFRFLSTLKTCMTGALRLSAIPQQQSIRVLRI